MTADFTNKFQKEIKKKAHPTIHKDEKLEYVNLHPNPPTIIGLVKKFLQ
jgi:hypothetical protein